jgi:hypothetical protein
MPSFTVTAAGQRVNLGISGGAQASFTVTNTSTQALSARMVTRPGETASPEWFSIVGESVREVAPNEDEQVLVQLSVPPTAPAGAYSFRLDAVSAADPDEDFTVGPYVEFDVEGQPPPKKKFPWVPWWILAIVGGVVLLVIIAVIVFLLVRSGEKVVTSGNATIPTNQAFDVNSGAVSTAEGADVLWRMVNFWAMVPAQGSSATLVNMGVVDFDSITARQLSRLNYSTQPIPAYLLVNGDVFAVRSDKGNFAKVKVLDLNVNLGVQWVTYRRGG